MFYRLGKMVKSWRRRIIEQITFTVVVGMVAVTGTVLAVHQTSILSTQPLSSTPRGKNGKTSRELEKPNQNTNTVKSSSTLEAQDSQAIAAEGCIVTTPAHGNLASSTLPELRKLAEYEAVCGGAVAAKMMFFASMPINDADAKSLANDTAVTLKEYARFGISPLVILEPVTSAGTISFSEYQSGRYDSAMNTYFSTLKSNGITGQMMGTWVAFPEANIPEWGNTNPNDFAACVTKTVQLQKKYFPASNASVMLDSKSYPSGTWESGTYTSLLPYVKNIPKGLIDSFGYQGFPWPDPKPDYNAAHFLNPDIAKDAAQQLGVTSIWFNTGSFSQGKAYNGQTIAVAPEQRQAILYDIIAQAKKLQVSGFSLSISLFAENKLNSAEGIDWSYWNVGNEKTGLSTTVFQSFIHEVRSSSIEFWLFDSGS
jgi:hypothetical protein